MPLPPSQSCSPVHFVCRVATKWDVTKGEYRNKKRLQVRFCSFPGLVRDSPAKEGCGGSASAAAGCPVPQLAFQRLTGCTVRTNRVSGCPCLACQLLLPSSVQLNDDIEARAHWTISYSLPAIEGCAVLCCAVQCCGACHAALCCAALCSAVVPAMLRLLCCIGEGSVCMKPVCAHSQAGRCLLLATACLSAGVGARQRSATATLHTCPLLPTSICLCLPSLPGRSMGTAARHINREMHADVGYAHLDIPRLELVVWPRGKPSVAAAESASNGSSGGSSGAVEGAASTGGEVTPGGAAASGGSGQAAGSGGSSSSAASISGAAAADEHLPEYLRGEASGGTAVASRGSSGGGRGRRKAAVQQLNSHVASLSGRWWKTFGSSSGGGGSSRD